MILLCHWNEHGIEKVCPPTYSDKWLMHGYVENSRIDFYSLLELRFQTEIIFFLSSNIRALLRLCPFLYNSYIILVIRKF